MWEKKVDKHVKKEALLESNLKTLYSIVWGQCSDIMRQKIQALPTHETMSLTGDGLGLLRAIKDMSFNFQSQKYVSQALHEAKKNFYKFGQYNMTPSAYLESFQNLVDVIEHCGGTIGLEPGIQKALAVERGEDLAAITAAERAVIDSDARDMYLATAFILGADKTRYGRLLESLENEFLMGQNKYPTTVTLAYGLLTNWKQERTTRGPANDKVSFTNVAGDKDAEVALTNN